MRESIRCRQVFSVLAWNLGWIILAAAWLGPLPWWAASSFTAHMTLHMAVVAVAAPLISVAIAGRRFDPVHKFPNFFAPVTASVGELIIVWAWHSPRLHHWARFDGAGFLVEQSMFLLAGLWVWLSAFGGPRPRSKERSGAGLIALLLTSMHMTLLGALLALSPRILFLHHTAPSQLINSLDPLADQQLGGAIMLTVGGIAFLAGGLWLMRDLLIQISAGPVPTPNVQSAQHPTTFRSAQKS